ncbi:MAG: transcriptional repressor LexA [Clostridiales bacterium]|nr:transcriptional repressor LexA [Clostridiales bacterium]
MKKGDIKEAEIFEFIKSYTKEKGFPPSYREIAIAVNIKSTNSIKKYVDRLVEKKLLVRHDNKARCLNYTQTKEESEQEVISIPLIGKVAAGNPILAFENVEDELIISKSLFNTNQDLFMLKISGDSMINIGIEDGDYVVVKKQNNAENGDIVVAYLDGYATVKNFYKTGDSIRLQPQNEFYKPIITKDCTILGKVIGCIKRF